MSEQTIQNNLFSNNVILLDKYECLNLGATTLKTLMDAKKIKRVNIEASMLRKKPDVLVINKSGEVVVYLEQKAPEKFKTEKDVQIAIDQQIQVAKSINAKIYIVNDGENFIWLNPLTGNKILDSDKNSITTPFKPKDNPKELVDLINNILSSIDNQNDTILKKEDLDPTDLAQKINRILKNLTFASAKLSLYTFVEVFLFKYLSDIGVLKNEDSFEYVCSLYKREGYNDANVLGRYLNGARTSMKNLFPAGEDGTTIINGQIFHAEKAINDWVSQDNTDKIFKQVILEFKKYEEKHGKFLNIGKDFKSKLFETFMKNSDDKSNMGQFFTPLKVVKEMVNIVDIKEDMKICDPASGVGKFLLEAVEDKIDDFYQVVNGDLKKKVELIGYDKMMSESDDITMVLAKANMLIYFSKLFTENNNPKTIQNIANKLMNDSFKISKSMLGTLDKIEENTLDVIFANPPYYQSKAITEEARKTGQYTLGGLGIEALFLEWIMKSLKYGGIATIVLPDGIFSNIGNKKLKEYMKENFFIENIISLPIGTFFNTPKKTYILTIRKKTEKEMMKNIKQEAPVFTYIAKSIGETLDINRFDDLKDNDLHEAVNKYNNFKNIPNKINIPEPFNSYFSTDKQLKFVPISDLKPEESWIIENFWSEEEKIEIGLKEKGNMVSIGEFKEILNDTIALIEEFKGELEWIE